MGKFTIFYADDDVDDLMFFEEAVTELKDFKSSLDLKLVKEGLTLIEDIESLGHQNAVVFLDLNMPFKSGFDLLVEIRNHSTIKDTPVIIYSTSSNIEAISKSKKLGANYYAIKPNSFGELKKIISRVATINLRDLKANGNHFIFNRICE